MTTSRRRAEAVAVMATAGALWGSSFAVPLVLDGTNPATIAGLRFVLYGAFAAVPLLVSRAWRGLPWRVALRHAALGYVGMYFGEVVAIRLAGAAPTVAVVGTIPVVYAWLGARRDGIDPAVLAPSLGLLVAGHVLIQAEGFTTADRPLALVVLGLLVAAVTVVAWCRYALDNTEFLRANPAIGPLRWSSAVGVAGAAVALPLLAVGLLVGSPVPDPPALVVAVALFLAVGPSWVATAAWNRASLRLPRALAGQLIVFEPLFGFLFVHLWLGAWPTPLAAAGEVLLLAGAVTAIGALTGRRARALAPAVG